MIDKNFDFSKLFNIKKFHTAYISAVAEENDVGVGCLVFLKAMTYKEFYSQQELSEFIGCNKAHTSRIISSMLKKGYILPPPTKNDCSPLSLTEKGKNLAKKVEEIDKIYINKMLENVSKDDLEIFKKVCRQIYENSQILSNSKHKN